MPSRFHFVLRTGFIICAVASISPPWAIAQNDFFQQSNLALKEGNRLLAIDLMRKGFEQSPAMKGVMPQFLPLISDYQATVPYSETKPLPAVNADYVQKLRDSLATIDRLDAIQTIVDLARDRQVVILNEAHDMPQHRAFGLLLALELRKIGFDFMAMETLVGPQGGSGLVEFEYPTLATGNYSGEPVFGDFVRQTARAGYQMIAYEIEPAQRKADAQQDPTASIKERENAQSDNLIKHVLEKHPGAKLFVYVGYSHATEDWETLEDGTQLGWMAAQLRKKTGIDPLTIDQVGGSYNPKNGQIDPVFQLIQTQAPIENPSVLRAEDGSWLSSDRYYQKTDLSVFHPAQAMVAGRPDWLRMNGYRKPFVVENRELFAGATTLVQAYLVTEGDDALPVDQLLLDSPEGQSTFLLPAGSYRTEIRTIDGSVAQGPRFEITE